MKVRTALILVLIGLSVSTSIYQTGKPQPAFSTSSDAVTMPVQLSVDKSPTVSITARIHSFDVSPDEKTIALGTSQGVALYSLDLKKIHSLNDAENVFNVVWSPDGAKLAVGSIIMRASESGISHLVVWDVTTWKVIFERKSDEEVGIPFGALAWSPDGNLLATSLSERGLVALDVKTGKIVSEQKDFLVPPSDVSWSPDGSRLIGTGDLGFGVRRWRLDTGEAIRLYDARAGAAALQLAWSPDGERIASAHMNGTICFWTVATNKCDGFIQAHERLAYSLAWSFDGSQLATGGGIIRLWDTHTGQQLTAFGQNGASAYTRLEWLRPETLVSFEMDYENVLTIVRFWNVDTGSVLFEFQGAGD